MDDEARKYIEQRLKGRYGIYYGHAWFSDTPETKYLMVMSFGLNPQYGNIRSSAVLPTLS
jgi:FAD synthase